MRGVRKANFRRLKNYLRTMLCPICGDYRFQEHDDFDICPICGWENDGLQNDNPDYAGGANWMSVNQAREAFRNGKQVL